jgi:hypothetical protein
VVKDRLTSLSGAGIKKAKGGCVSNMIRLTYKPELFKTNRDEMCPAGFCGEFIQVEVEILGSDIGTRSGLQCRLRQGRPTFGEKCNPYENLMEVPRGSRKWRMSCDEFPFGNLPFLFFFAFSFLS